MTMQKHINKAVALYESFRERKPKKIGVVQMPVPKAVACIGYVEGIDYRTTHGKKVTFYHHDFVPGSRPLFAVSADGKQLLMLGGRFKFTERGIVDRDAKGQEIENAGHGKTINPRGPVKLLTLEQISHFRRGGNSPLGWPLQEGFTNRAVVCRACGKTILKHVTARWVAVSFNDNSGSYTSSRIWLHDECGPVDPADPNRTAIADGVGGKRGGTRVNNPGNPAQKWTADDWRKECNYISGVTDKRGNVPEMNRSKDTFLQYCEMQRKQAEKQGFHDAALYIQECIDELHGYQNPKPRKVRIPPANTPERRAREAAIADEHANAVNLAALATKKQLAALIRQEESDARKDNPADDPTEKRAQVGPVEVVIFRNAGERKSDYPCAWRGYMEHDTEGELGGLWFDAQKRLIDYDGLSSLSPRIVKAIRAAGFTVPRDFAA